MGKEWDFTAIFGIPKSFARRKTELARKKAQAKILLHFREPLTKPFRGSIVPYIAAKDSRMVRLLKYPFRP